MYTISVITGLCQILHNLILSRTPSMRGSCVQSPPTWASRAGEYIKQAERLPGAALAYKARLRGLQELGNISSKPNAFQARLSRTKPAYAGFKSWGIYQVLLALLALANGCSQSQPPQAVTPTPVGAGLPRPYEVPKKVEPQPNASASAEGSGQLTADDLFDRGFHRQIVGDAKGAIEYFNQAISNNSGDAIAYYYRGLARIQLGDKPQAIADFTQVIQLESKNTHTTLRPLAYTSRGDIRAEIGEHQQAMVDYKQAADFYQKKGDSSNYQKLLKKMKVLQ